MATMANKEFLTDAERSKRVITQLR